MATQNRIIQNLRINIRTLNKTVANLSVESSKNPLQYNSIKKDREGEREREEEKKEMRNQTIERCVKSKKIFNLGNITVK